MGTRKPTTRSRVLLALLLGLSIGWPVAAVDPPRNLRVVVNGASNAVSSRTSGVAPLSVHFTAGFAESTLSLREFHSNEYTWDFGDPGAGSWGTTGLSKNRATGGVATHVYESPGTYTATLTVRNAVGVVGTTSCVITVDDPDTFYAGTRTICVSDTAHGDFTGAPPGANQVTTDDLSEITHYATAASRILFHRGSSWTIAGLDFPGNAGPVTLGAYGTGTGPDELGIYANAPRITITAGNFCDLSFKQDWRIMDLHLVDPSRSTGAVGGASDMQRILFLRLHIEGFRVGLGWSHYNDANPLTIDQMVVAECRIRDGGDHNLYVGSERLALLGNIVEDAHTSHCARVWQAYRSVISHNVVSGSSLANTNGRHALKLHGPGRNLADGSCELCAPAPFTTCLRNRTQFVLVADNVFGASGPWPVSIGPQDALTAEEISDVVVERNRFLTDYGTQNPVPVNVSLHVGGRYITIRNNVFDGTGSAADYTGIGVGGLGDHPPPLGVEIYHNTVAKADNAPGYIRIGIDVGAHATLTIVRNNLVSFPGAVGLTYLVRNYSQDLVASHNLLTSTPGFVDPGAVDPLARSFALTPGSPAIGVGTRVPVYDDLAAVRRPIGRFDAGAYER